MPATAEDTTQQSEFFGPGISVEMGKIQRELKKLWQQSDQIAMLLAPQARNRYSL